MNKNKLELWLTGVKELVGEPLPDVSIPPSVASHSELVRIVAIHLPELEESYNKARKIEGWLQTEDGGVYHFGDDRWADALAIFLEVERNETNYISQSKDTFKDDKFPYEVLIAHWSNVLDKYEPSAVEQPVSEEEQANQEHIARLKEMARLDILKLDKLIEANKQSKRLTVIVAFVIVAWLIALAISKNYL